MKIFSPIPHNIGKNKRKAPPAPTLDSLVGVVSQEVLDKLVDKTFCLSEEYTPRLCNDGSLRPLAETMYASQLMYLQDCASLGGVDQFRFINVRKMVEAAMALKDFTILNRDKTSDSVLELLVSYGAHVRQHWATGCILVINESGESDLENITKTLEGLSFGQTNMVGQMLKVDKHVSIYNVEILSLKREVVDLKSHVLQLSNMVSSLVQHLGNATVRRSVLPPETPIVSMTCDESDDLCNDGHDSNRDSSSAGAAYDGNAINSLLISQPKCSSSTASASWQFMNAPSTLVQRLSSLSGSDISKVLLIDYFLYTHSIICISLFFNAM